MSPLVPVEHLLGVLASVEPVTLLDIRWTLGDPAAGRAAYTSGHLPGAAFVDLDRDLAAAPGASGRHPLPDPEAFAAAMRRADVRPDVPVVVYDQRDSTAAARAWWLLRHHGHRRVSVLDGGFEAWTAAGGAVSVDVARPSQGDFVGSSGPLRTVDADGAATLARRGVLLDARSAERYRGDVELIDPVAGHIPGAISAPTTDNVDASGLLLPADVLRHRFRRLGVEDNMPVGVYCGSGVTATHEVLALQVAGVDAALYPGSWSHWITDPTRPVATGPSPG